MSPSYTAISGQMRSSAGNFSCTESHASNGHRGQTPVAESVSGVLGLDLLASDPRNGVVGRDRGLAETDRNERDLSLVAGHVTGRVHTRERGLHRLGLDEDLPLAVELEAPVGDRAEMRMEAEQ